MTGRTESRAGEGTCNAVLLSIRIVLGHTATARQPFVPNTPPQLYLNQIALYMQTSASSCRLACYHAEHDHPP